MTRGDVAILALRLAAIYAWFQAVEFVASGIISLSFAMSPAMASLGGVSPFAIAAYIFPCVVLIVAGLFLWLRAPVLARNFVTAEAETVASGGSTSTASLAFAVVGLAVFLYALPRAVSGCITLLRSEHFLGRYTTSEFLQQLPSLAGNFLQLASGFFLFIRSHRLASWWARKRDSDASV